MRTEERIIEKSKILDQVKQIVLHSLKDQPWQVILFGSWARSEERHSSDIDIGIWRDPQSDSTPLLELKESLEESTIPYKVDIVDLVEADEALVEHARKEGIRWKDGV